LERKWQDGDRVELELALPLRLEAINSKHPDTVALVRGPLVLFAMGENQAKVTREQLLGAKRIAEESTWAAGDVRFKPFVAIEGEKYNTYLSV
jgi:hypothetical protein